MKRFRQLRSPFQLVRNEICDIGLIQEDGYKSISEHLNHYWDKIRFNKPLPENDIGNHECMICPAFGEVSEKKRQEDVKYAGNKCDFCFLAVGDNSGRRHLSCTYHPSYIDQSDRNTATKENLMIRLKYMEDMFVLNGGEIVDK